MAPLQRIAIGGASAAVAAGGIAYAVGGLNPVDTDDRTRKVVGIGTGVVGGLGVAGTALFEHGRFTPSRIGAHAGRLAAAGLVAGVGMSWAFANDFSTGDMSNEGHFESGLALAAGAASIGALTTMPRSGAGNVVRIGAGAAGAALAGWFAGSAFGDYASGSLRSAPPSGSSHF